MIHWIMLLAAGLMEIFGVIVMKRFVDGEKLYLLAIIGCFALSFTCLSVAMQEISMGVAYAIWTGIGAAGGVIVGVVFYKEDRSFLKLLCVCVIIITSIGLKAID